MSTSRQTFTQVKDILKKLDKSIDAARERRLQKESGDDRPNHDGAGGESRPRATATMPGPPSGTGSSSMMGRLRATPMRPSTPTDGPKNSWEKRVG